MSHAKGDPGPPPAPDVDIEQPTTSAPASVDMGMLNVEVRASGGTVLQVFAETYNVGATAPTTPSEALSPHPTTPNLYVGQIGAPCSNNAPFPNFRIKAMAEFQAPNPMNPSIQLFDDDGPFEGQCASGPGPGPPPPPPPPPPPGP